MMQQEFEQLYGQEIPQCVYDELEKLYMVDDSTKEQFVERVMKQHLVQSISRKQLAKAESMGAELRKFRQQYEILRYYVWGDEEPGYVSTWQLTDRGEIKTMGKMRREDLPKGSICDCPYN